MNETNLRVIHDNQSTRDYMVHYDLFHLNVTYMSYTGASLLWEHYNYSGDVPYPAVYDIPLSRFQFGSHVFKVWFSSQARVSETKVWTLSRGNLFLILIFFSLIL